MAFTWPGTSSWLKWPAPTVWPTVIAGHRRRRSADALDGTAEPMETTGTVTLVSTLASNSPMTRMISAAMAGGVPGICPMMAARLTRSLGRNIPSTNFMRHAPSSSAATASTDSRKNALARSFVIGAGSTITSARMAPGWAAQASPIRAPRLWPTSTGGPNPAAPATASTSRARARDGCCRRGRAGPVPRRRAPRRNAGTAGRNTSGRTPTRERRSSAGRRRPRRRRPAGRQPRKRTLSSSSPALCLVPALVQLRYPPGQLADQGAQFRRVDDLDLGAEREHVERGGVERADPHPGLGPALTPGDGGGAPADPDTGRPAQQRREAAAARGQADPCPPGPGAGRGQVPGGGGDREIAAESLDQLEATRAAADRVERDAGRAEGLDVAEDRALGDLKLAGQLPGAHPAAGLEQPHQAAGSHRPRIIPKHDRRCHVSAAIIAWSSREGSNRDDSSCRWVGNRQRSVDPHHAAGQV